MPVPIACVTATVLVLLAGQAPAQPAALQPAAPGGRSDTAGLELQVRLDRAGFSPGEIDGRPGMVTRKAVAAFQRDRKLPDTGTPDENTLALLSEAAPGDVLVPYAVTADDVAGPYVDGIPEDMMERSKLPALSYTSPVEQLGERFHASPALLKKLNPSATFAAGETLQVPNVRPLPPTPAQPEKPAPKGAPAAATAPKVTVTVSKSERTLTATDDAGRVLLYVPVTVGSENDPLPIGDWKVTGVQRDPVFHYNPDLFWDADSSHARAKIPAGPNNPVGVVWIDLSRPHYGLHGTPEPSQIGRTESHGCVRLTNWDALSLAALVSPGTPVLFRP
jgi:lipoprotein-anchoring transpeptidase ErfK/SrfK